MVRRWAVVVTLMVAALFAHLTAPHHASASASMTASATDQPSAEKAPDGSPPDRSPADGSPSGGSLPVRAEAEPAEPARCHPGTADLVPGPRNRVQARDLPPTAPVRTAADGGHGTAARELPERA